MKRSLLFVLIALLPALSFGQGSRPYQQRNNDRHNNSYEPSTLSIFSETGEQFFLVLNGVAQNNVPTSRIRVEGLPEYGNDIEIIFADRRTQAIRKRINVSDPVDDQAVDMTLRLTRERDGFMRLRFFKCVNTETNYRPVHDEYVMYYGRPGRTNTTTTTTTTYDPVPPPPPVPAGPQPMDTRSFIDAKNTISNASFESTKYSTAKTLLAGNYFTTEQVMQLCNLFSFENTKLAFAKDAYSKVLDQNNYYKLATIFSFDSNKQALNNFINGR